VIPVNLEDSLEDNLAKQVDQDKARVKEADKVKAEKEKVLEEMDKAKEKEKAEMVEKVLQMTKEKYQEVAKNVPTMPKQPTNR
jgi:hypothetical protein